MSRSWCTNRSFMVLMSLVKSPIAMILFIRGTHSDAFVVAAAPTCSISDVTLTGGSRGCSSRLRKRRATEQEHRENGTAGPPLHVTGILAVAAYVRRVTPGLDPRLKLALSRAAQRHVF